MARFSVRRAFPPAAPALTWPSNIVLEQLQQIVPAVAQVEAAAAGGLMPLEHLLAVMRDPNESEDRRMSAAIAAALYCHRKLKIIEHSGPEEKPVEYAVALPFD